jgi:phospholipase/carboxylesterase
MTLALPVVTSGAPLPRARAAVVLLHGRGATAESMLVLAGMFAQPDMAYIALQGPGNSWYPYSFLASIQQNEPFLSRSLAALSELVVGLAAQGFGSERLVLLGFSQGGCLALEFVARNARRYGAVIGLSAGLIGPDAATRAYAGTLAGTPTFIGCSDIDGHIPLRRVQDTSRILRALGGHVVERIYPGMGHTINDDEIKQVRAMLDGLPLPQSSTHPKERHAS